MNGTLGQDDIGGLLGKSRDWFYRNRDRLQREHRFPAPIDGVPGRWSRAAVLEWIDGGDGQQTDTITIDQADLNAPADGVAASTLEELD